MGADSVRVAAVVLNWNGRDLTLACLRSLAASLHPALEVIVVDNASTDDSVEAIRREFPDVEVCANAENLGYSTGMNTGIRRALELGVDHVLPLNNDTVVDGGAIPALVDAMGAHPRAAGVCPLIYYAEPADVVWYSGAVYDPSRGRAGRMLGFGTKDAPTTSEPYETTWLTGAALMIRRVALERIGLFDEDLFYLCEDVDWSLRARAAGYTLHVAPRAVVWHAVSRAHGGEYSPSTTYYGVRNQLVVCRRHAPLGRVRSARRTLVASLVYLFRLRRSGQRARSVLALMEGLRDARNRRLGRWRRAPG